MPGTIVSLSHQHRDELMKMVNELTLFSQTEKEIAVEIIDECLADNKDGYVVFILEDPLTNMPIGFISIGSAAIARDVWEIYWIIVRKSEQRKNYGRALLEYAENFIRSNGARMITVETSSRSEYEPARYLYEKSGYERIAHLPDFYDIKDDLFIYSKRF